VRMAPDNYPPGAPVSWHIVQQSLRRRRADCHVMPACVTAVKEVQLTMCSRAQCLKHVGQYVQFRTRYGYHQGVLESVSGNQAVILSPRKYIPVQLIAEPLNEDAEKRLDVALAWGGYGGGYGPGPGPGYGGYGGYAWGGGWARWAVSFLVIYALWGLLLW
jgi:hypothetical protein